MKDADVYHLVDFLKVKATYVYFKQHKRWNVLLITPAINLKGNHKYYQLLRDCKYIKCITEFAQLLFYHS